MLVSWLSSGCGGVQSEATPPPSITTQPTGQSVTVGQTATFSVAAGGTAPLSYKWLKNGTAIPAATSSSYTTPPTTSSDSGTQFAVVVSNSVGSITSSAATLTVNTPPSITTQPTSQSVTVGQTATFSVVATGTAPLSYQWQENGVAIAGATSSSYTTPATSSSDSGSQFAVVVSNLAGIMGSSTATLTVTASPVAPSITTQPASQSVTVGQTATFSVVATGTAPLSYQWQENGVAIAGATSSSYTTPATTGSESGSQFTVVISNSLGNVTSSAANLTVNAPLTSSASNLDFDNVDLGANSLLSVTLANAGGVNITISNITVSGAGFSVSGVSAGLIVGAGQTATLSVTFAPLAAGPATGSVSIASDAPNSPTTINLSGAGVHWVDLNWVESSSLAVGYNVYRGTMSLGPLTAINSSPVTATQYDDDFNVQPGQIYYYVVTALSSKGLESAPSNEISVVTPTPFITSLSTTSGPVGTAVVITGMNFGSTGTVTIDGIVATTTSWSATTIVTSVPVGASTTGNVVVTAGGVASNGVSFTVTTSASGPTIMSLSPTSGPVGMAVVITGTNFGSTGTVTFNGTAATMTSWSATSIATSVPAGATTGNVVVTVGGVASNGVAFTVSSICGENGQNGIDYENADWGFGTPCVTGSDANGYTPASIQYWVGNPIPTSFDLGIYADNAGSPGSLLCHTGTTTLTPIAGWNDISLSEMGCPTLSANTQYWVGYITGSNTILQGTVSGTCPGTSLNSVYTSSVLGSPILPNTFGANTGTPSCYSVFIMLNSI